MPPENIRGRRGRGRSKRWVSHIPPKGHYRPMGAGDGIGELVITIEELEAMRLVDYKGLTQEEAAERMHVSRKTLWSDLQRARKKVVDALIHGLALKIEGGNYTYYEMR